MFNGFDFDELYDLEADPYEMTNLAPDPAYEDVLREMATRMWQRIRETGDFDMIHSHYGMFRYAPVGPRAGQDKELGANATKVIANGNEM